MKIITNNEIVWAQLILSEITENDDWWSPISDKHQIFEQCYMKFVNKNLNYFNFENMLLTTIEGHKFNKSLSKTLEFCEYVRTLTGDRGPFGRMCVWKVPSRSELLAHIDNFKYHNQIVRNIFIVSKHNINNSYIQINDSLVEYDQGTLFQFYPAREQHCFKNNSDIDWYFLGFDYWIPSKLFYLLNTVNLTEIFNDPIQQQSNKLFGIGNCKYMSDD